MRVQKKSTPEILALETADPLRAPTLRTAISTWRLAPGTHGLDIGCGIGLQTLLLAEAIQPDGHVTGLDISPELLAYARQRVNASHFANRISFKEGDMRRLPFEDDSFDWAWSADCVGYPAGDNPSALKEIARVLRPGGLVSLLGWTSQQVLPGYPLLEARLNADCSAHLPYLRDRKPEEHFLRLGGWFTEAGIRQGTCRTFIGEVRAPLSSEIRRSLVSLFEMLWSEPDARAPRVTWLESRRLCDPESPDFILDIPDYYAFFTYTMFTGVVEKS